MGSLGDEIGKGIWPPMLSWTLLWYGTTVLFNASYEAIFAIGPGRRPSGNGIAGFGVEANFRERIQLTHPDTHGNSPENHEHSVDLNEAIEFFRKKLAG